MKLLCTCDSPASACQEREIQAHLTPLHTSSYLLATAAKYHLIFKSPSLLHIYPYNPLLITSYNVLFMEMHFISCKCYTYYTATSGILYIYSSN